MSNDFYSILGFTDKERSDLLKNQDQAYVLKTIKEAYKSKMRKGHTDKGGNGQVAQDLIRAHEILTDEDKRKIYDFNLTHYGHEEALAQIQKFEGECHEIGTYFSELELLYSENDRSKVGSSLMQPQSLMLGTYQYFISKNKLPTPPGSLSQESKQKIEDSKQNFIKETADEYCFNFARDFGADSAASKAKPASASSSGFPFGSASSGFGARSSTQSSNNYNFNTESDSDKEIKQIDNAIEAILHKKSEYIPTINGKDLLFYVIKYHRFHQHFDRILELYKTQKKSLDDKITIKDFFEKDSQLTKYEYCIKEYKSNQSSQAQHSLESRAQFANMAIKLLENGAQGNPNEILDLIVKDYDKLYLNASQLLKRVIALPQTDLKYSKQPLLAYLLMENRILDETMIVLIKAYEDRKMSLPKKLKITKEDGVVSEQTIIDLALNNKSGAGKKCYNLALLLINAGVGEKEDAQNILNNITSVNFGFSSNYDWKGEIIRLCQTYQLKISFDQFFELFKEINEGCKHFNNNYIPDHQKVKLNFLFEIIEKNLIETPNGFDQYIALVGGSHASIANYRPKNKNLSETLNDANQQYKTTKELEKLRNDSIFSEFKKNPDLFFPDIPDPNFELHSKRRQILDSLLTEGKENFHKHKQSIEEQFEYFRKIEEQGFNGTSEQKQWFKNNEQWFKKNIGLLREFEVIILDRRFDYISKYESFSHEIEKIIKYVIGESDGGISPKTAFIATFPLKFSNDTKWPFNKKLFKEESGEYFSNNHNRGILTEKIRPDEGYMKRRYGFLHQLYQLNENGTWKQKLWVGYLNDWIKEEVKTLRSIEEKFPHLTKGSRFDFEQPEQGASASSSVPAQAATNNHNKVDELRKALEAKKPKEAIISLIKELQFEEIILPFVYNDQNYKTTIASLITLEDNQEYLKALFNDKTPEQQAQILECKRETKIYEYERTEELLDLSGRKNLDNSASFLITKANNEQKCQFLMGLFNRGKNQLIDWIFELGIDAKEFRTREGGTLLHVLISSYCGMLLDKSDINEITEYAEKLINAGIDINAKNNQGETALCKLRDFAKLGDGKKHIKDVAKFLINQGADIDLALEYLKRQKEEKDKDLIEFLEEEKQSQKSTQSASISAPAPAPASSSSPKWTDRENIKRAESPTRGNFAKILEENQTKLVQLMMQGKLNEAVDLQKNTLEKLMQAHNQSKGATR